MGRVGHILTKPPIVFIILFVMALFSQSHSYAAQPEIWLAPPDNMIVKRSDDFDKLFKHPELWSAAASDVRTFSVSANYLLKSDPAVVASLLGFVHARSMKLLVALPSLPVDKHKCGDGVEGTIWPGEASVYAQKLRDRNIQPDYIGLDLPLTSGHLYKGRQACNLTVSETAQHLSDTLKTFRTAFPNVQFVDAEVPTGIPLATWQNTLAEWLSAVRQYSGLSFYSMVLDVWWEHPWQQVVPYTVSYLHNHGLKIGVFVDSDGHSGMTGSQWISDAQRNACALRKVSHDIDFVVIANWTSKSVETLPENQSNTLTGLAKWFASTDGCR